MFTIKTILVPTDFHEPALAAFETAKGLAATFGSKIVALHVADVPSPYRSAGYDEGAAVPTDDAELAERVEAIGRMTREDGGPIEQRILIGEPKLGILREAERLGCDLIAMGTAGRRGIGRLLLGSVAEHVLRAAPCPVLLVKAPADFPTQIDAPPAT